MSSAAEEARIARPVFKRRRGPALPGSVPYRLLSALRLPFSIFLVASPLLLLLMGTGCQVFTTQPTPSALAPTRPVAQATITVSLPTPPPGATLTAMVEAYRKTHTPHAAGPPTTSPVPTQAEEAAAATPTAPVGGPSIRLMPEVTEPGAQVEVHGTGWQPAEEISVGIGATIEQAEMADSRGTAGADGTFATPLTVPAGWTGMDAVVIAQSADGRRRATARLYVLSPTETAPPSTPSVTPTSPPAATPTPEFKDWRGEYYDNSKLAGDPKRVRDDSVIDFNWEQGAPAAEVPSDAFSVRWTRQIDFPPGGYAFDVEVDDGVRVFIDGLLVLDEWKVTSTASYEFQQVLEGSTEIRVEYFDAGGNATIRFQWHYLGRYPNWRAAYYDNPSLSGAPVIVRNDIDVNFEWGGGSPAPQVPPDNFSARWTRIAPFDAGNHRFHAQADDGVRVWVGSQLLIDQWHTSTGEEDYVADIYLSSGSREIRVEYYEAGGKAEVHVWWENLDAYAGWRGAYYDNRSLSGQPVYTRDDADIDFNWVDGGPDEVGADDFSVQWTDRRGFETATYRLFARHDDGVRVWVDSRLVIDEWYETGAATYRRDVELMGSFHELRVEYFEATGEASIRVWWELAPYR